jgi:anaerobic selenocysteine-containing dehydrogenase
VEQLAAVEEPAPLVLIPRRLWRRVNSYARDLPSVLEHEPANVLLHPADAADAGVADGDPVQVESAFGRLTGTAKVDGTIRRGAVAIPHGLAEPNVSVLLSGRENVDPLTGMPTYSGVPVTLSAA